MPLLDGNGNPVRNAKGKVITIPASEWLAKNRSVESMTWAPGEPEFIRDRIAVDSGWLDKPGATSSTPIVRQPSSSATPSKPSGG